MTKKQYELHYKLIEKFANDCKFKPEDTKVSVSDRCTSYTPSKGFDSMSNDPQHQMFSEIVGHSSHIMWWLLENGWIKEKKEVKRGKNSRSKKR